TEGISEGDRIVNNPSAALLEGDKVRIVTASVGYDIVNPTASNPTASSPTASSPTAKPVGGD
ncbi:MAG: efflux RND transporter periplasmic adaptor subunit, partial [Nitrospirales bacterium]